MKIGLSKRIGAHIVDLINAFRSGWSSDTPEVFRERVLGVVSTRFPDTASVPGPQAMQIAVDGDVLDLDELYAGYRARPLRGAELEDSIVDYYEPFIEVHDWKAAPDRGWRRG